MSSRLALLQALPLPALRLYAATSARCLRTTTTTAVAPPSHAAHCCTAPRRRHLNPRLSTTPGKNAFSAMASASTHPPPMYRANVGVCLINRENKVRPSRLAIQTSPVNPSRSVGNRMYMTVFHSVQYRKIV